MIQFTIRDVLWVMVVVGLGAGCGLDHWFASVRLRKSHMHNVELWHQVKENYGTSVRPKSCVRCFKPK